MSLFYRQVCRNRAFLKKKVSLSKYCILNMSYLRVVHFSLGLAELMFKCKCSTIVQQTAKSHGLLNSGVGFPNPDS